MLSIAVSSEELQAIQKGEKTELYRTATDDWFAKLYEGDPKTGLVDTDRPIQYKSLLLDDGQNKLEVSYKKLEVEEFMNQPIDSDERFGFVLIIGGPVVR